MPHSEHAREKHSGLRELRQAIAKAVLARMKGDIPGLSAHFGEDYQTSEDPEAITYLRSGGQFLFLAFAFRPWRMWDLHVGIVPTDESSLSLGFHISERAAPALMQSLRQLGAGTGTTVQHQAAAFEYQANFSPMRVDDTSLESIVDTVCDLCRKCAPAVAEVTCPPEMRDDA